ncbi:hemophore-related protein [Mycobacteroides chelonae]|uniref:heme-binding protein n=1 Tax=Mycobacteroides chelonae TaxID=1774 RepID=UPI00190FDFDC|nr:heme-binding protein [Mycobacteroides chelonae]QQG96625.1 hemophore-related protein [Mycobacteroides chelonae]
MTAWTAGKAAVVVLGGVAALALGGPAIAAADPPNCTAADMAGVATGVSAATSTYLFTHPDVNEFFTSLKGQPKDQVRDKARQYLDENPQVKADLQEIRQPLGDFRERCK